MCWLEGAPRSVSHRELYWGRGFPGPAGSLEKALPVGLRAGAADSTPSPALTPSFCSPHWAWSPRAQGLREFLQRTALVPGAREEPGGGCQHFKPASSCPPLPQTPCLSSVLGASVLLLTVAGPLQAPGVTSLPCSARITSNNLQPLCLALAVFAGLHTLGPHSRGRGNRQRTARG